MTTLSDVLSARLTSVRERLQLYKDAEEAILLGAQSYTIKKRTLTRADLDAIARHIKRLETEELKLMRGGNIRVQRVVPRDM